MSCICHCIPATVLNHHRVCPRSHNIVVHVTGVDRHYDTDTLFPVVGFGGCPGRNRPVDHCLPLSDGSGAPEGSCAGLQGVMAAYNNYLHQVVLSGPTLFAPIIQHASALVASMECSQSQQKYLVLLIITDGTWRAGVRQGGSARSCVACDRGVCVRWKCAIVCGV